MKSLKSNSNKAYYFNYKYLFIITFTLFLFSLLLSFHAKNTYGKGIGSLKVRSVDTMKFSRDAARKEAKNGAFDLIIDRQISQIASLNTTHVAIDTPYDEEFVPFLRRWVQIARKYKLKVWFRGNLSGWEGWFEYPEIDKSARIKSIEKFIKDNKDIFQDGDIFTSCPECENGQIDVYVDPESYKKFIIDEHLAVKKAFLTIRKSVIVNYNSMNGDIAQLIMDRETTKAMDGIVTVDHYIQSQEKLVKDLEYLAEKSGGRIVLGEVGVSLADIHGEMTESEQRDWLAKLFVKLNKFDKLEGINYWLSYGGSTALWDTDGNERLAAEVVRNAYAGRELKAKLIDRKGQVITDAEILTLSETYLVDTEGVFSVPYLFKGQKLEINAKGYPTKTQVSIDEAEDGKIILEFDTNKNPIKISLWDRILKLLSYPIIILNSLLTPDKI